MHTGDHNTRLTLMALHILAGGDLAIADQIVHPDYHNHEAAADPPGGSEGFKDTVRTLRAAFEDISFEAQDIIACGDKVVVRGQFSARHVGPYAGMPITGRTFSTQHIHVWRIADGKLIEHWATRDDARAMRQLGLLKIGVSDNTH
jgi:predicted ester cyclase